MKSIVTLILLAEAYGWNQKSISAEDILLIVEKEPAAREILETSNYSETLEAICFQSYHLHNLMVSPSLRKDTLMFLAYQESYMTQNETCGYDPVGLFPRFQAFNEDLCERCNTWEVLDIAVTFGYSLPSSFRRFLLIYAAAHGLDEGITGDVTWRDRVFCVLPRDPNCLAFSCCDKILSPAQFAELVQLLEEYRMKNHLMHLAKVSVLSDELLYKTLRALVFLEADIVKHASDLFHGVNGRWIPPMVAKLSAQYEDVPQFLAFRASLQNIIWSTGGHEPVIEAVRLILEAEDPEAKALGCYCCAQILKYPCVNDKLVDSDIMYLDDVQNVILSCLTNPDDIAHIAAVSLTEQLIMKGLMNPSVLDCDEVFFAALENRAYVLSFFSLLPVKDRSEKIHKEILPSIHRYYSDRLAYHLKHPRFLKGTESLVAVLLHTGYWQEEEALSAVFENLCSYASRHSNQFNPGDVFRMQNIILELWKGVYGK